MAKLLHFYQKCQNKRHFLFLFMMLAVCVGTSAQEKKLIRGKVIDERTREVIAGASVLIKNSNTGIVTGINGEFALNAGELPVAIEVSYIGYKPQEIEIYEISGPLTVLLSEDLNLLNEVVIVGYGTVKKSDLTGSVSSVKTGELLQTPIVSVDQGLLGRASGVQVTQTSGMPGSVASIRIRGSSSLQGGNEPLYVIDGFPVYAGTGFGNITGFGNAAGKARLSGLSTVNPSDIESIEILKDASATAIYGARAANGVVLITTRQGKKGRDNITFESSLGFSDVVKKIDLMGAQEYAALVNEAYLFDGNGKPFYDDAQMAKIAGIGKGTDWQEEIFRTGVFQNYQLTFSGGDEKTQYAVSGNYLNQKGIIVGSGLERFSARVNLDRHATENFTLGTRLSASHTMDAVVATDMGAEGGTVTGALKMSPILPVYSDPETKTYTQVNTPGILIPNPVATALEQKSDNAVSRLIGDLYLQWKIIPGLTLKISAGTDVLYRKANLYTPSTIYQSNGQARAEIQVLKTINWLNENTLAWNKEFGENSFNVLGGFTMQRNNAESVGASSSGFVNDVMEYNNLGAGSIINIPASDATQWSLLSYLARINYTLKNRYLVSANARVDGSSRFGLNNKFGIFPSVAGGWRISEEPFWETLRDKVPVFKLRGSYGITGNTEIGVYESLATLGSNSWVIGNQQVTGFFPDKIANPDLKWEKTAQFDIGLDAGFLHNRIRLTADYYRKKTADLLYSVAITGVSGYNSMLQNIGSLENKGFEFSVESDNLTGKFGWNTSFNIAFNRNKILELGGEPYKEMPIADEHLKTGSIRRLVVGKPIGIMYGYRFDGIFQDEDEVKAQTSSPSPIGVGLRRYKDLNEDGKVDATNDREILGDSNPDFFGGVVNNFFYKGFELNLFLQYSYGNKIFNYNSIELEMPTGGQNVYAALRNRWTPSNPSQTYPRASTNRAALVSDRFVEDGSYLKLKTLSVSYNLPLSGTDIIRGARIYVTAQNLLTFTKYTGYDPEVSYRGASTLEAGEDFGGYPQSRTILIGLKIDIK